MGVYGLLAKQNVIAAVIAQTMRPSPSNFMVTKSFLNVESVGKCWQAYYETPVFLGRYGGKRHNFAVY